MSASTGKKIYHSKEELMADFSPNNMARYCVNRERCVTGKAPRLSEVADQFGQDAATDWIIPYLMNLVRSLKCKETPSQQEYEDMAFMIFEYKYLKLTEIMLFFHDYENGNCGEFFGNVGKREVNGALKDFVWRVRPRIIREHDEQEKKRMELESRKENEDETRDPVAAYAFRIRSRDFRGEIGADAKKVEDMICREDFSDERLGDIAREVGEQLIEWWSPVYALRIKNKDYKGKIGETAEAIGRVIKAGTISSHWYFGGIERRVKEVLEQGKFDGNEREPGAGMGKPTTLDEFLLIKAMNGDFDGSYGEAARQKAKEMEAEKDSPF